MTNPDLLAGDTLWPQGPNDSLQEEMEEDFSERPNQASLRIAKSAEMNQESSCKKRSCRRRQRLRLHQGQGQAVGVGGNGKERTP